MITVSERIVSIGVKGNPYEVSAIVDKLKFKHPMSYRIASYALYRNTGGAQGWDGYIRPLKKVTPRGDHAEALRGYKWKILEAIENLGFELSPETKILESPFSHITSDDVPDDIIKSEFPLDENQREIIAAWLKHGMGIGKIAVNGGKTASLAGFAGMLKSLANQVRLLYITDRERLTAQVDKEMNRFLPGWHITKFGGGSSDESGKDMVICTLAMLRHHIQDLRAIGWFNTFHAIMFDECVSGNTQISLANGSVLTAEEITRLGKPVEVFTLNEQTGKIEPKMARGYAKGKRATLVISVDNGAKIRCTANHPIFTKRGWVAAGSLKPGDFAVTGNSNTPSLTQERLPEQSLQTVNFVRIKEIKQTVVKEYVYDLSVEDNHNYFANNILVHNCHHAAAESVEVLLQEFKGAFFRVAASDTIKFDDPIKHDKITGLCGPVLMTVHQDTLIESGRSAVPHIYLIDPKEWKSSLEDVPYQAQPGTTAWVLLDGEEHMRQGKYVGPVYDLDSNGNVKMKKSRVVNGSKIESVETPVTKPGLHTVEIEGSDYEIDSSYCLLNRSFDRCIVNFKERNKLIAEWVKYFSVDKGKRTLVVATRTIHVLVLEAIITSTQGIDPEKVMTLIGEDSPSRRNKIFAWFKRTPGAILISPLVKEGVSINEIEAGVVADYVGGWEVANQIIGRFLRKKEGDNTVDIAWFIDRQQRRFEKGCLSVFKNLQSITGYIYYWPVVTPADIENVDPSDTTAMLEAKLDRRQKTLPL